MSARGPRGLLAVHVGLLSGLRSPPWRPRERNPLSDEMLMKLGLFDTFRGWNQKEGLGVWGSTLKLFLFSVNAVGIPLHEAVINRRLIRGQGGAVFKWN